MIRRDQLPAPMPPHASAASVADLMALPLRFIALDVETANGDPASICQIGLAGVQPDGRIATLGFLVNPRGAFERFNTQLHGIDAARVRHAPAFPEVCEALRPLLERTPLVQHSGFDRRAMASACARYGLAPLQSIWHDSVTIARRAWPQLRGSGGHGLGNLKEVLGLHFEHHDAVEDARAAAQVVLCAEATTGHPFDLLTGTPQKGGSGPRQNTTLPGNAEGPLFGLVACFTGKLSQSRPKMARLAADAGVTVTNRVDADLSVLIIADPDLDLSAASHKSAKRRRAEDLMAQGHALRILHETEFLDLIAEATASAAQRD